ncbi:MAG: ATP-grasp domain-containing protein [Sphingomonadaceae bacterium]|nr:ATP-grasp domain-containing protein [Sphingomonadaceae bacterium]
MRKLLIANRGEIACRIIRTARRLGIRTVAVFSDADAGSPHVRSADEAFRLGPPAPHDSYLSIPRLIEALRATGADAVHPGYGFLSENAEFAEAVIAEGRTFVGPSPDVLRLMGLKDAAKARMKAAGLPVLPGMMPRDPSLAELERLAVTLGFPLVVKAVAGGGGRGLRVVHTREELLDALVAARREAAAAFGNDALMLERLVRRPRHVEVQVFGDVHGNVVHMFERDCSVQRRHQKLVEEAPAPGLSERVRQALGAAAVTAAQAIGYCNAGTVEFLLDLDDLDSHGDPRFFFIEMNPRLQVEHPVTEAITGLDLVEWQLCVARGEMLPLCQDAIEATGHAIEVRLCAEQAEAGFLPATGRIARLVWPDAVRVDTGVEEGSVVGLDYDSLLAKLVVHGPSRAEAIERMVAALDGTVVEGVATNRGFLARVVAHPTFRTGDVETGFLPRHAVELEASLPPPPAALAAVAAASFPADDGPGFARPFRLNLPAASRLGFWSPDGTAHACTVGRGPDGVSVEVAPGSVLEVRSAPDGRWVVRGPEGTARPVVVAIKRGWEVRWEGFTWRLLAQNPAWARRAAAGPADGLIAAPMPGRVLALDVEAGTSVRAGDRLLVLEAMKMEHRLLAPFDGVVEAVWAEPGAQVTLGAPLLTLARAASSGVPPCGTPPAR